MTRHKIDAFLKLFCIRQSGHVSLEPSWQSWAVLLLCVLGSLATFASGAYFHRNDSFGSSVACFAISFVGFGVAILTFIAILLGFMRRRTFLNTEANDTVTNVNENYVMEDQKTSISTSIQIEDLARSHFIDQISVFVDNDKTLYEADWNIENGSGEHLEKEDTDFDDLGSYCSESSTDTCSYNSCSDDEGCFPYSSKENNLKDVGKDSKEFHQDRESMFQQDVMKSDGNNLIFRNDLKVFNANRKLQVTPLNSNQSHDTDALPYEKSSTKVIGIQNCPRNNIKDKASFTDRYDFDERLSIPRKTNELNLFYEKQPFHVGLVEHDKSQCRVLTTIALTRSQSIPDNVIVNEDQNGNKDLKRSSVEELETSLPLTHNTPLQTIGAKSNIAENSSVNTKFHGEYNMAAANVRECSNNSTVSVKHSIPTITEEPHAAENESSNLSLQDRSTAKNGRKTNLPDGFPSLPYPVKTPDMMKTKIKKQRRGKDSKDFFVPRYEKRPLLDINGAPISQTELVKVLTELLINGLRDQYSKGSK